jgi:hypothetical protein
MLLCVIGVLALAACGDDRAQSPSATVNDAAVTTPSAATGAVPQSLALSVPRVGGGTIDLADYAGKPVLLWFWAPT